MAIVIIPEELENKINKKFKKESIKIFELLFSLEKNPKKGKEIGCIGKTIIKELKYKSYRFYFITDGYSLKVLDMEDLQNLIIKFVRMSDKKTQQKTIDEIKQVLRNLEKNKS